MKAAPQPKPAPAADASQHAPEGTASRLNGRREGERRNDAGTGRRGRALVGAAGGTGDPSPSTGGGGAGHEFGRIAITAPRTRWVAYDASDAPSMAGMPDGIGEAAEGVIQRKWKERHIGSAASAAVRVVYVDEETNRTFDPDTSTLTTGGRQSRLDTLDAQTLMTEIRADIAATSAAGGASGGAPPASHAAMASGGSSSFFGGGSAAGLPGKPPSHASLFSSPSPASSKVPSSHQPASADKAADEDEDLEGAFAEQERVATVMIDLPPIRVPAERAALYEEYQRQVAMQLEGLNSLTAKDWLINTILNRMKTPEQQMSQTYGTKSGQKLAGKIDTLLRRSNALAAMVMEGIQRRMVEMMHTLGAEAPEQCPAIIEAAEAAQRSENVYSHFRHLKGLEMLSVLSRAGLSGGTGRQHGEGDEVSFRKEYSDGIELAKHNPVFRSNACLHNPDQCAGGPMELLWRDENKLEMQQMQEFYRAALKSYHSAKWRAESYRRNPPKNFDGSTNERLVEEAEEQLSIVEDEVEQAMSMYMHTTTNNLGNFDVNSDLGKAWMEDQGSEGINRVDMMLSGVLDHPLEELGELPMQVTMGVRPPSASGGSGGSSGSGFSLSSRGGFGGGLSSGSRGGGRGASRGGGRGGSHKSAVSPTMLSGGPSSGGSPSDPFDWRFPDPPEMGPPPAKKRRGGKKAATPREKAAKAESKIKEKNAMAGGRSINLFDWAHAQSVSASAAAGPVASITAASTHAASNHAASNHAASSNSAGAAAEPKKDNKRKKRDGEDSDEEL